MGQDLGDLGGIGLVVRVVVGFAVRVDVRVDCTSRLYESDGTSVL